MKRRQTLIAAAAGGLLTACAPLVAPPAPRLAPAPELANTAPPAPREFRAAWVATVANIDWPTKPGLSAETQQAEMRAILDRAVSLKLNALILQVRTSADALYESRLEPWSEYLSGTQGQSPGYDPLALWVTEAHQRGLELHAWFNPFRARQTSAKSANAATHLSQTQPQWVKRYGDQQWIDPGEQDAADHTLAVFKDVLQRYDVDGIHIDDYFYPYPIALPGRSADSKEELDFPDEPAWQRYVQGGGTLARHDWRRRNVDQLIERLYAMVRATKPWVRFGVSPFGLGKPALRPEGISGFSQYDKLYADVERWLAQGWMDYLVPQVYWPRTQKGQAFEPLLNYWHAQNPMGRHVWAGMFTSRISAKPDDAASWQVAEVEGQIGITRANYPGTGHVHFSMAALRDNRRGLSDTLRAGLYAEPALVPATPWLEAGGPAAPLAHLWRDADGLLLSLINGPGKPATRYAVWLRVAGQWRFAICHGTELRPPAAGLEALVVSALDRVGNEGPRSAYRLG